MGIGWYENNSPRVCKESIAANNEKSKFSTLSREVRSKIIIAHLRKGTVGGKSEENSHPFQYNNWLFAHNGTVERKYLFSLLKEEYKEALS